MHVLTKPPPRENPRLPRLGRSRYGRKRGSLPAKQETNVSLTRALAHFVRRRNFCFCGTSRRAEEAGCCCLSVVFPLSTVSTASIRDGLVVSRDLSPILKVLCFSVAKPFVQERDFPAATVPGVCAVVCMSVRCADREAQEPGTTPLLQAVCHSERESTRFLLFWWDLDASTSTPRLHHKRVFDFCWHIGVSCFLLIDVRKRTAFLQKDEIEASKAHQLSSFPSFLHSFHLLICFFLAHLFAPKLTLQRSPL